MPQMLPEHLSTSILCVREVKALARLPVCANTYKHWMIKYSISVNSLMSYTKQLFSSIKSCICTV